MALRDWLPRRWRPTPGPGQTPVHVDDPRFDDWEVVRDYYEPFECCLKSSTSEVYYHEIPGGQYSNLRPQVASLGLLYTTLSRGEERIMIPNNVVLSAAVEDPVGFVQGLPERVIFDEVQRAPGILATLKAVIDSGIATTSRR